MASKVLTPEEEIKRLRAELERQKAYTQAVTEGKDQTGTYGWTNMSQEDADKNRSIRLGKRFISDEQRNDDGAAWSARGGDQIKSPESNTVERDATTGKVISAPDGAKPDAGKPFEPVATVDAPPDERTII